MNSEKVTEYTATNKLGLELTVKITMY